MEGEEHGGRKKAFHLRGGGDLCAWVGAERRIQKVQCQKTKFNVACQRENTLSLSLKSPSCGAGVKPYG